MPKFLLEIISQTVACSFTLSLGVILTYEQIPGNRNICDAGQGLYIFAWVAFTIVSCLLLINSYVLYKKNQWKRYRLWVIGLCSLILFTTFNLRWIIFQTQFGEVDYHIESTISSHELIDLKLYENTKFYVWTYDMGCQIENTGTYTIQDHILSLHFENEKSKYMSTRYRIAGDYIICMDDCANTDILKVNLGPIH